MTELSSPGGAGEGGRRAEVQALEGELGRLKEERDGWRAEVRAHTRTHTHTPAPPPPHSSLPGRRTRLRPSGIMQHWALSDRLRPRCRGMQLKSMVNPHFGPHPPAPTASNPLPTPDPVLRLPPRSGLTISLMPRRIVLPVVHQPKLLCR